MWIEALGTLVDHPVGLTSYPLSTSTTFHVHVRTISMKRLWLFLCVMALMAFAPLTASAETNLKHQPTVQASPATNVVPDTTPLAPMGVSLMGLAFMGATRKITLGKTYLFNGESYGPGADIDVPEDFPDIDGDTGDVIHEEGSPAARNAARARSFSSAPNTGGVNTGENLDPNAGAVRTVSGKPKAELEKMTVADLESLAVEVGVPVERGDGQDGEPLKADYVKALSAKV